ncbi:TldD/PmbA family protein [Pseudahrensia aquimaris]|uniref:TldD/PmbA family protein n=1 Tax=Pseudahrensia aquimaris TaxID=744461 RepID=A0ABW3FEX2_9HYPH
MQNHPTDSDFDLKPLQDRAIELVDAAKRAGADAGDAVVASSRSTGVDIRNGAVEEIDASENDAFSLRVFVGNRSASVSANRGGDAAILAERAVAMAKVSPENTYGGLADEERLAKQFPDLDLLDNTVLTVEEMTERARACEEAALAVKGVTKSSGSGCGRSIGGTVLATSHGFIGSYAASRYSLSVSAVAGEGTGMERDYDFDSKRHLKDLRDPQSIGKTAGERTVKRLSPQVLPTQQGTIIFEPRMARSLVGHMVSALNGASVVRKTSFLRDAMGEAAFSETVRVTDRPHRLRGLASRPFDGEGVALEDLPLIDGGVIQNWLLDSATARELGLATNGRANRSGSSTSPGTTNLTLDAGQRSLAQMIADTKSGLLVTELIGQGVNMVTGDYSRGASGFRIENGELTYAVSEITIAGNLKDMFKRLEPASEIDTQGSIHTPAIAIEGLTIAGR